MKIRNLVLVGVLSCVVFAIALFPASLLWGFVSRSASGLPLQVERVGGTVWNGYALTRVRSPMLQGPVVVGWDLKALRLLLGEAAVGLHLEGNEFRLDGSGHWGLWGKGIKGLSGEVQSSVLNQALRQFGVRASGVINVDELGFNLAGKRVTGAEGTILWSGGQVRAPATGARDPIDFPPVKGQLREEQGNLYLTVTESKGNQLLGEAGLLPEKGLGSVRVLQRVLSVAGMGQAGSDDNVLVNMQQPLPF